MSQKSDTLEVESNVTSIETAKVRRAKQRVELESILIEIDSIDPYEEGTTPIEQIELSGIFDRCAKLPKAYDGEVAKRCVEHFGMHPSEIAAFKYTIQQLREGLGQGLVRRKERVREAEKCDYFELFESSLGKLERDIFSGDLMCLCDEGFWVPAFDYLDICKSDAAEMEASGVCRFRPTLMQPHFKKLESIKPRKLIIDFEEWDGRDRIAEIAHCIEPDGTQPGCSESVIENMIKAWLAGALIRVDNPRYQNPCLILFGPQEAGKDYLIDTITDGFCQWTKHLALTGNLKDDFGQLSRALIFKIPEFDKTAKTDQATLKDMIWRPDTFLRDPYDKRARDRIVRCSFVSSTNDDDIYKDPTGHRRYWPINLRRIDWSYPSTLADRKQVAAQARELAKQNYQVDEKTQLIIRDYIKSRTPDKIEDELADHWDYEVVKYLNSSECSTLVRERCLSRGWISVTEARDAGVIGKIIKAHGISERYLYSKLSVTHRKRRSSTEKGYSFKIDGSDGHEEGIGHTFGHPKDEENQRVRF